MRILVINGSSDLYGANRILAETMEILSKHHQLVLVLPDDGPLLPFVKKLIPGLEVIVVPNLPTVSRKMFTPSGVIRSFKNYLSCYQQLKKIKKSYQCNLAYINTLSCFLCIKMCKQLGLPTLVHVHEIIEQPKSAAIMINKLSMKWSDRAIAVSHAVANNLALFTSTTLVNKKVSVIHNGIPAVPINGVVPLQENQVAVTLIGRIKPEKGIWFFLDAIALLDPETVSLSKFHIVGGAAPGGEHFVEKLRADIEAHPYGDAISFTEFRPDVTDLQRASDLLVIPSLMKDPFPTTVLEAMRVAKPVIATNHGGAAEAVKDQETGFLIHPHDKENFAIKLQQLIANAGLRKNLGQNALERFNLLFDKEHYQHRFEQFFKANFFFETSKQ